MKKKLLLIFGSLGFILTIALGGTYAVFQADGSEVVTNITTTSLDIAIDGDNNQIQFKNLVPGQNIQKRLSVKNQKETSLYTRVTLRKYWLDQDGHKDFNQDANKIQIQYNKTDWLEEYVDMKNGEDIVLYYKLPVDQNAKTTDFITGLTVPQNIGNAYQGKTFALDITVDAIQSVDGVNAMQTQWGVLATLNEDGTITNIER